MYVCVDVLVPHNDEVVHSLHHQYTGTPAKDLHTFGNALVVSVVVLIECCTCNMYIGVVMLLCVRHTVVEAHATVYIKPRMMLRLHVATIQVKVRCYCCKDLRQL